MPEYTHGFRDSKQDMYRYTDETGHDRVLAAGFTDVVPYAKAARENGKRKYVNNRRDRIHVAMNVPAADIVYSWILSDPRGCCYEQILNGTKLSRNRLTYALTDLATWGLIEPCYPRWANGRCAWKVVR